MRDIIIVDLLSQSLQVIDNHLQTMEHLWNALIILHIEACQLVLDNAQLGTLHRRCALICFLQSLLHLISSLTILDLLKNLGINGIVDGVESHCIALLVGLVLVGEIVGINDSIVTLGHIPHLIID
jgi:type II secretory pathway component PulJ